MVVNWKSDDRNFKRLIIAGDIGGTNANIGIIGECDGNFTLILECIYETQQLTSCVEAIQRTLNHAKEVDGDLIPTMCCISAAGPVVENICTPSHIPWNIDGAEIADAIGVTTLVINDFMAISYSLPLLDVNDPDQILKLPHTTGDVSPQVGNVRAIVGAGTGLGVGYLIGQKGNYIACASEGGHIGFPAFDPETRDLKNYIACKLGHYSPGVEPFVSGQGIVNLYHYIKDARNVPIRGVLKEIDDVPDTQKPALITKYAHTNPVCADIVRLFVKLYARFASDAASFLLPTVGLYLAGGIVTKTEKFFLDGNLFMHFFEQNYNEVIRQVLKAIPVYIIRDYSVSLYGAANAAVCCGRIEGEKPKIFANKSQKSIV